jgi:hypothetical protein
MKKGLGILFTFNGLSMFIVWPLLITFNQAPEIQTNPVYMLFHLVAEFLVAFFCLISGLGILLDKKWAHGLYYPTSGLFLSAGYLAIGYFIFSDSNSALPVLFLLVTLNIIGLVFLTVDLNRNIITALSKKVKLDLFFQGVLIYTLINVAGFLSEMNSGYTYAYVSMALILILHSAWKTHSLYKPLNS